MRKVILSMMVSVDGFIEGQDPEYNWHNWDNEMAAYMMDFFKTVDTFIYGRKSYEAMIAYWAELNDEFANVMNQTKKLVFFRTLKNVVWNSRLINTNSVEETCSLKKENFECNSSYASLPFLFLNCIFFEIILQLTVFLRG